MSDPDRSRVHPETVRLIAMTTTPSACCRLLERLSRELPAVEVVGVVYAAPLGPVPGDSRTMGSRVVRRLRQAAVSVGDRVLGALQASRVRVGPGDMDPEALGHTCRERGWALLRCADLDACATLKFLDAARTDLGLVIGPLVIPAALGGCPSLGWIRVQHDLEGANVPPQVGLTVLRLGDGINPSVILRRAELGVQPYDTPVSLRLKTSVMADDLIVDTVRDLLAGPANDWKPISSVMTSGDTGAGGTPSTVPAANRTRYWPPRGRPAWKLLVRSSLYTWYLPARNWLRRLRRRFPVVILYHHLISDRPHPMGIPTEAFLAHVRYLKRHYRVLSLPEAVALLESGRVTEPTAVLTLDDGYADNFLNLRAVLRMEPTPVTFFVCSDLILHGGRFPVDVADGRDDFRPLTPDELRVLAAEGVEIGSHTRTHFDCGSSDVERLRSEIIGSGEDLAKILGRPITCFSFPLGHRHNVSPEAAQIARACYTRYCSADGGLNWPGDDDRDLRRIPHPADLWELELALQGVLGFTARLGTPEG
jgi:peptidoglycan/xylan/chitin deacetylase (PgdA/CDA1 family)